MNEQTLFEDLRTVRDFIRWATSRFVAAGLCYGHGTDNPWDEAVLLVMHAIHFPAEGDARILEAALTREEKRYILDLLERRIQQRVPAPYLTGTACFAGMQFAVDERVLIPRSPLAELIEDQLQPWVTFPPGRILDLCTGSGCIGIALAHVFPEADVDLSDISEEALAVAEDNIARHDLQDRVAALQSDLFEGLVGRHYDLIIANPPYVDAPDLEEMPAEYGHEPLLALASGADGLDFTRRLLREAAGYLSEEGILIVEVGNSWVNLEQCFPSVPFTWVEFERGGEGVFIMTRQQLLDHQAAFDKH